MEENKVSDKSTNCTQNKKYVDLSDPLKRAQVFQVLLETEGCVVDALK
jgi:hypothetical protein